MSEKKIIDIPPLNPPNENPPTGNAINNIAIIHDANVVSSMIYTGGLNSCFGGSVL